MLGRPPKKEKSCCGRPPSLSRVLKYFSYRGEGKGEKRSVAAATSSSSHGGEGIFSKKPDGRKVGGKHGVLGMEWKKREQGSCSLGHTSASNVRSPDGRWREQTGVVASIRREDLEVGRAF